MIYWHYMNKRHHSGFTIVEVIIVVVVIALLAVITIFGFNTWRSRAARSEMKSELLQSVSAVKNYRNYNNTYPVTVGDFQATHKAGGEVTLTYTPLNSGLNYCIRAASSNDASVWYVTDTAVQPTTTKPGTCP